MQGRGGTVNKAPNTIILWHSHVSFATPFAVASVLANVVVEQELEMHVSTQNVHQINATTKKQRHTRAGTIE